MCLKTNTLPFSKKKKRAMTSSEVCTTLVLPCQQKFATRPKYHWLGLPGLPRIWARSITAIASFSTWPATLSMTRVGFRDSVAELLDVYDGAAFNLGKGWSSSTQQLTVSADCGWCSRINPKLKPTKGHYNAPRNLTHTSLPNMFQNLGNPHASEILTSTLRFETQHPYSVSSHQISTSSKAQHGAVPKKMHPILKAT